MGRDYGSTLCGTPTQAAAVAFPGEDGSLTIKAPAEPKEGS
jgi:hypothetical protein